jgi:hypothetical protein
MKNPWASSIGVWLGHRHNCIGHKLWFSETGRNQRRTSRARDHDDGGAAPSILRTAMDCGEIAWSSARPRTCCDHMPDSATRLQPIPTTYGYGLHCSRYNHLLMGSCSFGTGRGHCALSAFHHSADTVLYNETCAFQQFVKGHDFRPPRISTEKLKRPKFGGIVTMFAAEFAQRPDD